MPKDKTKSKEDITFYPEWFDDIKELFCTRFHEGDVYRYFDESHRDVIKVYAGSYTAEVIWDVPPFLLVRYPARDSGKIRKAVRSREGSRDMKYSYDPVKEEILIKAELSLDSSPEVILDTVHTAVETDIANILGKGGC